MAVAVNPVTNKIYVVNQNGSNVTVIDGATSLTTTVTVASAPWAVAVNPVTNKIYVAHQWPSSVTVIDGASNLTTTVASGTYPIALAVNPVTNKVYVANQLSDNVTVIDGASNLTTTVAAGSKPWDIAVNPVTNKVYVANDFGNDVTVIDGTSNVTTTVAAGTSPIAVAVNPVTDRAYVANQGDSVTVIDEQLEQDIPLHVAITPLPGNVTTTSTPTFTFTAETTFAPTAPPVMNVYYQVDTLQGDWSKATSVTPSFAGTTGELQQGVHILYAFASDGMTADSVQTGQQSAPLIGTIQAYMFVVDLPAGVHTLHFQTDGTPGSSVSSETQTVADGGSAAPVTASAPAATTS